MSIRRLIFRLHPRRLVQGAVIAANVPPFTGLLARLYRFGLRRMLRSLSRHAELHAVYGTGSFFEGSPLYGHSDIDLILVFKVHLDRGEGAQHSVARTYNRVRRFFPFLGQWSEKSANLIFLSESAAGFPLPASFRVRMKRRQLVLLAGEPVSIGDGAGDPTHVELLDELDTLVRLAILTSERWTARQIFWKGLIEKLIVVADGLGLNDIADATRSDPDLPMLRLDRRTAYFRGANVERLFQRFMDTADRVRRGVAEGQPSVTVTVRAGPDGLPERTAAAAPGCVDRNRVRSSWTLPSVPLGLLPKLFYVSLDESTHFVEFEDGRPYHELRTLAKRLKAVGGPRDIVIVRTGEQLLLFTWQPTYIDVIPLDPLVHAPAYALLAGNCEYSVPLAVFDALQVEADQLYGALAGAYERHMGWLPSRTQPEVYVEDDIDTIRDALDILRAFYSRPPQGLLFTSAEALFEHLAACHPAALPFLGLLGDYYAMLRTGVRGDAPANNLYRCLHQFMSQVLAGEEHVELDSPDRRLGLTVGIVTRNRARDLVNALDSLTQQRRPPDEVIIVDNGSTDDTRAVAASFNGRLPLSYHYLADASIPNARNRVLELASHEIVAFTDDDCGIPAGWLASMERAFLRADNVGLVGGWVAHWPAERESAVDTYYEIFHGHKT